MLSIDKYSYSILVAQTHGPRFVARGAKLCAAATAGLITFITPSTGLVVGSLVNNEPLPQTKVLGCALVTVALGRCQDGLKPLGKWCERRPAWCHFSRIF